MSITVEYKDNKPVRVRMCGPMVEFRRAPDHSWELWVTKQTSRPKGIFWKYVHSFAPGSIYDLLDACQAIIGHDHLAEYDDEGKPVAAIPAPLCSSCGAATDQADGLCEACHAERADGRFCPGCD